MKTMTIVLGCLACYLGDALGAAPVKTVPWNGYKGAVTFTFDDGCPSQIANVLPALKSRGIHATFFLPGSAVSGTNKSAWIQAAKDGNELANHTVSHIDLTTLAGAAAVAPEVNDQATALRNLDPSVEAVTLAYPYCNTNAVIDSITDLQTFIARTCSGSALFSWSTKPANWMQMTSNSLHGDTSVNKALNDIDSAAKGSRWLVTLDHCVGGDWLSITTAQAMSLFDRAIADSLWIDTYQDVAGYWRASFTMDTVQAKAQASSWTLAWKSPHARMPKSVMLRVKLDSTYFGATFQVYQKGVEIPKQSDGSYLIDFMKLQLTVSSTSPTKLLGKSPRHGERFSAQGAMTYNLIGQRVGL